MCTARVPKSLLILSDRNVKNKSGIYYKDWIRSAGTPREGYTVSRFKAAFWRVPTWHPSLPRYVYVAVTRAPNYLYYLSAITGHLQPCPSPPLCTPLHQRAPTVGSNTSRISLPSGKESTAYNETRVHHNSDSPHNGYIRTLPQSPYRMCVYI